MNAAEIISMIVKHNLRIFSTADIITLSELKTDAATQTLRRLQAKGILGKIKRGIWVSRLNRNILPQEMLPYLTSPWPSYVSLESALSEWGILSQIPSILFGVTTGKGRPLKTPDGSFRIYHLQKNLFSDYFVKQAGMRRYPIATPEKAALDTLYFRYRLGGKPNFQGWDLEGLNRKTLRTLAKKYPLSIQQIVKNFF